MSTSAASQKRATRTRDIRVNKESEIPLYRQLIEQIIVLISMGNLEPDDPLPTIRQLARQKKIHYNTVSRAYQQLTAEGWVRRRSGRALTVRSFDAVENPPRDLDDLIDLTIRLARQCGYTTEELSRRVSERFAAQPDHILVVSTDAGMCELLKVELQQEIKCSVHKCSPDELAKNQEMTRGALVVCLLGAAPNLGPFLPKGCPVVSLTICDTQESLEQIRRMTQPSHIALVSISKLFLQRASGVLASLLEDKHSLREHFLTNDRPISLDAADIVFCDSVAFPRVRARKVFPYQMISRQSLDQITERFARMDLKTSSYSRK